MLRRLLDFSLANRALVLIGAALLVVAGGVALWRLPIDAVPDVTNVQVQVLTKAPALGPVEIEQFITYPVEAAMNGLPSLVEIRSVSRYGLSAVTIVFRDGTDIWWARQLVNERLSQAREKIPPGFGSPEMGPVSTGLGEVFMFTVEAEGLSAMERRTLLDWDIAPRLRAVPGVTEVNVWGGLPKQYQVVVDPARLNAYGLALRDVFEAVERGSGNSGGGAIERNREQYVIRGEGLAGSLADIEGMVVRAGLDGAPVLVRNIADVREGSMLRIGAASADGRGETVIGIVQMLAGENALSVATRVREAVESLQASLPKGVRIVPYYDREDLVRRVIRTVQTNLLEGGLLVVAVLLAFLGNLRAGLIVASAIPLSMLIAFTGMAPGRHFGEPDEPRRNRLRPHRRRRGRLVENVLRRLASRRGPANDDAVAGHGRGGARGPLRPIAFGDRDHHPRLPADPHPGRNRGKDVQADGADGGLCPRLGSLLLTADARARCWPLSS